MPDPTKRPAEGSINEATLRAVQADRARVEAAGRAARRRMSAIGRAYRLARWLRNRQSGPLPRLRRVGRVVRSTLRGETPWRAAPDGFLTALLAPVRPPGAPPPPRPPRDWGPDRAAAAARLAAAADRLESVPLADLGVAAIADAPELEALTRACRVIPLRPEDWASELERAGEDGAVPTLLLVTSARNGNGGAWRYRIGWYAHPDSLLLRDLDALTRWCSARGIATLFVLTEMGNGPARLAGWTDAARLFDLVLVAGDALVAEVEALPDRRGAGAVRLPDGDAPAAILRADVLRFAAPRPAAVRPADGSAPGAVA
jgi:hypothetical protein